MKKDDTLNGKITYADMTDAVERWFIKGTIDYKKYEELRKSLALAFQIGCSEYLARMTKLVCGE